MAAPAATARVNPVGIKLKRGYRFNITCLLDPDISFWEKTGKPFGFDSGGGVDQTTQHNNFWRTMAARALVTATNITGKAAYDPDVLNQILAVIKKNTAWTFRFPDSSVGVAWAFLDKFIPDEMNEQNQPEASFEIVITNVDPSDDSEQGPIISAVAGT